MKLIAQVKLKPTKEQAKQLKATVIAANGAASYISEHAWMTKVFRQYDLHHALYYEIREKFALTAQMVVRVIAKVADAYKVDKKAKRTFFALGSIAYDTRILTWKLDKQIVSVWSLDGRLKMPFVAGQKQLDLLQYAQGEADLILRNGEWYIHQTCDLPEPVGFDPDEWLGVDSGIVNIATDSDGTIYSGAVVNAMRHRRRRQRRRLQAKQTKSATRVLRNLSGKERRFATNVNHQISKEIVKHAKRTGRGVILEDLKGIRERVRLRKRQRDDLHNWAWFQLHGFIEYKGRLAGVSVKKVDPRNTSRKCSCCGYTDKANRTSQSKFSCQQCHFSLNADHNAAINLAGALSTAHTNQTGQLPPS
ncbi:MAG: transposase [Chloroflexota bacterium]|nr:transposase [Chloroflexota bacterium]